MNFKRITTNFTLLISAALLVACGSKATPQADAPTEIPVVSDFAVVAEGRLVPKESAQLGFVSSGHVAEIRVAEGDVVAAGDGIARLGNRETLETGIANAQLELAAAQLEAAAALLQLIHQHWVVAAPSSHD